MQRKILLIDNYNLINGQGGVEHVLCNMANVLDNDNYNVFVVTMEDKEGLPFYSLNKEINFLNLYKKLNTLEKLRRKFVSKEKRFYIELEHKSNLFCKFLKRQKFDLIICFSLQTLLEVTYKQNYNIPIILTVHGNPINDYTNRFWPRSDFLNNLLEKTYNKANVVQVLLDSYKNTVPDNYRGKVVTIANIAPYMDYTIDYDKNTSKIISCIASLDDRKHQDLLINSFSIIADEYSDWKLELWGDGYKKNDYQRLIDDNNMNDRIKICGVTKQPKEILQHTDIFALPSICEGWPLVLGEAMSMGIPCIGLNSCDGVNEIIKHKVNGLLSNNTIKDFTTQLRILLDNAYLRKEYGLQAKNDMHQYTEDIIWGKWKELINKCLK